MRYTEAPGAAKTNESALERQKRWRSEVGFLFVCLDCFWFFRTFKYLFLVFILFFLLFFKFSFEGKHYKGKEKIQRNWEVGGIGVHNVKFPKNC